MIPAPDKSLFARQENLQKDQKAEIVKAQEKNASSLVSLSLSRSLACSRSRSLPRSLSLSIFLYFTLLICSLLYYTGNASAESIATLAMWHDNESLWLSRLHAHLRFFDPGM